MRQVPSYNIKIFREKISKYVIIIPILNEGQNINNQLDKMINISKNLDVVIADGGSTDGSTEVNFIQSKLIRAHLTKTGQGKLSAQMRMALDFALNEGYEGFIFIDGNNKDNPHHILDFIIKLDEGYDHIQGSRFINGGTHENTPLHRCLAIKFIHAPLISLASRFKYTDSTNGFRAYSKKFIIDPRVNIFRDIFSAYELHFYLSIRAARLNFKVIEIPVERRYPKHGKTPTKINGIGGLWLILKTLIYACMGKYNPERGNKI